MDVPGKLATLMFWKPWVREYLPLIIQRKKLKKYIRSFKLPYFVLILSKDITRSI